MAIAIQEYLGYEGIRISSEKNMFTNITESLNCVDPTCSNSIMVDIEGIHVGPTRNYTWYTEQALKGSISSWTKPYCRPLIMHHNESDGKIIGRVKNAEYTDVNTKSGTGALIFTVNIPDKEGKEQVKDGRLKTTSIGVIAHDVTCSICNNDIESNEEGESVCKEDHHRGNVYDGKCCYWMINSMEAKELSYVIVPSDIYAQNIRIYEPQKKDLKEFSEKGVLSLSESNENKVQKESTIVDETVKVEDGKKISNVEIQKEEDKAKNTETSDLQKEIEKLKEDHTKTVKLLQDEIEELKTKLNISNNEVTKEKSLREAAENEIAIHQINMKEKLVNEIITLREGLGKTSDAMILKERSVDSLNDSIKDLKEESQINIAKIEKPSNPTISTKENVVKKDNNSNINLAEEMEELFSSVISQKKMI